MSLRTRIDAGRIGDGGLDLEWRASEAERRDLADRLGVEAVLELEASFTLSRWRGGGVIARGKLTSRVTQLCVVTLDPVESLVEAEIDEAFRPAVAEREVVIDFGSPDDAEPFEGGMIDVAALVVDTLATAIDPYPRAPDAAPGAGADGPHGG